MPFQNNYTNLVAQKSEAHTRLIRDYDGSNPDFDYIVIGSNPVKALGGLALRLSQHLS